LGLAQAHDERMNRAFVKESDQDTEALPERAISPHPNLVTARGQALLEARVRELEAERSAARAASDSSALTRIARDLRYFQARRDSAKPVSTAAHPEQVRFGVRAVLRLADGATQSFQLVGEDEADPKAGLISYVSPLAKSLMGKSVGDELPFAGQTAEILELQS
jgi:transcription elongation GreA/GreB family factor